MRMAKLTTDVVIIGLSALVAAVTLGPLSAHGQALYGCDREGRLFTVDIATGAGTLQCELPTHPDPGATEIEYEAGTTRAYVQARNGIFTAQAFDIFRCHAKGSLVPNAYAFNGLEFVDGVLYGTAIPFQCQPSELKILDPDKGTSTPVGPTGVGPISGLAWDENAGIMYGITGCSQQGPAELVTIDLATGAATVVGPTGITAGSLEFGPDDMLYAGGDNNEGGNLYQINTSDGSATLIGPTGFDNVTGLTFVASSLVIADLDVKPTSCPNPLNVMAVDGSPTDVKLKDDVLPVAVLGTSTFNVADIDVSTILLEGFAPIRFDYEDVSAPVVDGDACECTTDGPDMYLDLSLKFSKGDVAGMLGVVQDRDVVPLTLTALLNDGNIIEGIDCVRIILRETIDAEGDSESEQSIAMVKLAPPEPNPFNPITRFGVLLARESFVRLNVFDVSGRHVARLVDRVMPAGEHVIEWNASGLPSGVYFYRVQAGSFAETRKVILLK